MLTKICFTNRIELEQSVIWFDRAAVALNGAPDGAASEPQLATSAAAQNGRARRGAIRIDHAAAPLGVRQR